MAFLPDFSKSNPYEGVTPEYITQIRGTQAYKDAIANGWFQDNTAIQPVVIVSNSPSISEQIPTYLSPLATNWKPDFTKINPYEGMPPEYADLVSKTFVPTNDNPLSPVQTAALQNQIPLDTVSRETIFNLTDAQKKILGVNTISEVKNIEVPEAIKQIVPVPVKVEAPKIAPITTTISSSEIDKLLADFSKVEEGYILTPQSQKMIDAMNNSALRPYLSAGADGKLAIDIGKAAAEGVNTNLLMDLGYTIFDIAEAKKEYNEYVSAVKQYEIDKAKYEQELKDYKIAKVKYDEDLKKFEAELKNQPQIIQDAYWKHKDDKVNGPLYYYNQAVAQYNRNQNMIFELELKTLPQELQDAYKKGGYDAFNKAVTDYNKKVELQQGQYDLAMSTLEPYKDKNGIYDITKYLADVKNMKGSDLILKNAGFSEDDIKTAQYQSKLNVGQQIWQGMTPWEETRGEKVSLGGATIMAAELLVPGVYTARHWNDMSVGEKSLAIAIDAVSLIPLAGAASRGARAVSVTGKATKAARLRGAIKGIGLEARAQLTAPVNIIIHPIGTAKTTFRELSGLVENIASKNRLPEAAVTNIYHTAKLRIADATSKVEAMAIRDEVVRLAGQSQNKSVFVQLGDNIVELRPSKLMKELGGGMASGTPFGELLSKTGKITVGENELAKGGMYFSPTPAPRFSTAASGGGVGKQHVLIIASPETAKKMVSSAKTYKGTAELEAILPEGEQINIAQKLYTRIGPTGQYTELWLEKPLTLKQIAKLKLEGLAETFKQPFQPVISAKGSAISTLSKADVDELYRTLRASGNTRQATSLMRAYAMVSSPAFGRVKAPTISSKRGTASQAEYDRAQTAVRREIGYVTPAASRAIRVEEAPRVVRVKEAERTRIEEPERRVTGKEEDRLPPRVTSEEPDRIPPRKPEKSPPRLSGREEPPKPPRIPPRVPDIYPPRPPRKPGRETPKPKAPKGRIYPQEGELAEKRTKVPQGSIAWRQGLFWKFIPPPWNQKKPITLRTPPEGAKYVNARSPSQTIQMIGKSDAVVPKSASIDLGVVDILIKDYGKIILFKGKGLETSVGQSGSRTTGMSIVAGVSARGKYRKVPKRSKRTEPELKRL